MTVVLEPLGKSPKPSLGLHVVKSISMRRSKILFASFILAYTDSAKTTLDNTAGDLAKLTPLLMSQKDIKYLLIRCIGKDKVLFL